MDHALNGRPRRIVVGMAGASGAIYGVRLLETLRGVPGVETHAVLSSVTRVTIPLETERDYDEVRALADHSYDDDSVGAAIGSGSFLTDGMVIAPCSMKTLSGIAHSYSDTVLVRAADVCLKERRKLVLVVRETPLHLGHLRLMTQVTEMGAILLPPMPAFLNRPQTVGEIVDHTVSKILDQFGIHLDLFERWAGLPEGRGT